ncbi:uncharacterized protein DDB_G0280205-like [Musca domestica]|uniref:Uncharacterized protein DDB_G0280205-like n=2 Tax=Musca domestica TaxID=7370 RepID=A0A9J7IFF4_MUSDO|nr:uncharacterized protein DDB_G0280205-like [Musca domestica]
MFQQYSLLVTYACISIVGVVSIQVPLPFSHLPASAEQQPESTSVKPSTLLLPPGFDSQNPPLQPMLYPFVVPTTAKVTLPTRKPIGPFITPGWIPISASSNNIPPLHQSSSTSSTTPSAATTRTTPTTPSSSTTSPAYSGPVLEDRISKYVLTSNENGPVFESIVYGTWKPDPPLQPVAALNTTTTTNTKIQMTNNGNHNDNIIGIFENAAAALAAADAAGKVSNKTINRQHGGFIDNKQPKPIKFENDSFEKSLSSSLEQKPSKESTENVEQKLRSSTKNLKKQGRQKIRTNLSSSTATATPSSTTMATTTSTFPANHQFSSENTEQSVTIPIDGKEVDGNVPPVEVVRQSNDTIEIKYNHKQSSRHSIEVTPDEQYNKHRQQQQQHHHNHRPTHDDEDASNDDDDEGVGKNGDYDDIEVETRQAPTANSAPQLQEDEDISVIRMNWPTDFMDTPLSSVISTERPPEENDSDLTVEQSTESHSAELPLTLTALNIPPSLWPKLPGNITKLGSPYATENSLEEPAICVPITVREFNMMNSNEVVNIERVFCFPMPSGINLGKEMYIARPVTRSTTTTTTRSSSINRQHYSNSVNPVIRASVQNYEEYFDSHSANSSTNLQSQLNLCCYCILVLFLRLFIITIIKCE